MSISLPRTDKTHKRRSACHRPTIILQMKGYRRSFGAGEMTIFNQTAGDTSVRSQGEQRLISTNHPPFTPPHRQNRPKWEKTTMELDMTDFSMVVLMLGR